MHVQNNIVSGISVPNGRLTHFESPPAVLSNNVLDAAGNAAGFVNPSARDFHLQSTSPARNAGAAELYESIADEFQARYGASIRQDVEGLIRPREGAYDVGAYEY